MFVQTDEIAMIDQMLETWRTNNRINLFLIDQISEDGMSCTLSKRGGRTVTRQFAHLHNVRVYHLEARAKDLAEGLAKFASQAEPSKCHLKERLNISSERITRFLEQCATGIQKRRHFKKGVVAHLGYLIAHESHHRGSILLTLKQSGHQLDQKIQSAIWNWDKM